MSTNTYDRNEVPGWEGSIGPFPGQYGKPHVYARDVHSGAGNCVCGNALLTRLHVQAAPGVPLGAAEAVVQLEQERQEAGRLRARVDELEQPTDDPVVYLLWSGRHQGWWAPDARGYTADIDRAGRYTRDEAVRYVVTSAQCGVREQVTSMVAAPENWPVDRG